MADDDENDIFLLRRAFRDADVRNPLHAVSDGQEAIDYLLGEGKYADRIEFPFPSIVILDLKMPRKTGLDVLRWLRDEAGLSCLPTIMLSSSAHPSDVENAYLLGANAFVVKPPGMSERTELARMIKGFWLTLNEAPLICIHGPEAARKAYHSHVQNPGRSFRESVSRNWAAVEAGLGHPFLPSPPLTNRPHRI